MEGRRPLPHNHDGCGVEDEDSVRLTNASSRGLYGMYDCPGVALG